MMTKNVQTQFPRTHVALRVSDLERSIAFYTALLGQEPARREADYAKFETSDPPLQLALNLTHEPIARDVGPLSHLGVLVEDAREFERMRAHVESAGLETRLEQGIDCCYALQDKVWITDPDGVEWEIYRLLPDAAREPKASTGCCGA